MATSICTDGYSRGLIEWVDKALWNPASFAFYRPPQDNEEMEDFRIHSQGLRVQGLL